MIDTGMLGVSPHSNQASAVRGGRRGCASGSSGAGGRKACSCGETVQLSTPLPRVVKVWSGCGGSSNGEMHAYHALSWAEEGARRLSIGHSLRRVLEQRVRGESEVRPRVRQGAGYGCWRGSHRVPESIASSDSLLAIVAQRSTSCRTALFTAAIDHSVGCGGRPCARKCSKASAAVSFWQCASVARRLRTQMVAGMVFIVGDVHAAEAGAARPRA
eukprot:scaffold15072_cov68-Phaeocystis_antarctica.AAC.18